MYDGETFTHLTEKEGLSTNHIQSILEDSHGNLWFGTTYGGVSMFDGESFTHFTVREGLSDNAVISILEDSDYNIWVGTLKGLNRIMCDPESVSSTKCSKWVIHTSSLQDGLKGMEFNPNSVLLDSKNRIWWGSGKSLTMMDMNNYRIPVKPPVVQLNRIEINEQFTDYRNSNEHAETQVKYDSVAMFYNYPMNPELPYNGNHLTFYFSAIDWSAPHKIKYSFKMEGINDNWSIPTEEAKADYRNMPYGTYTLKLRAIGVAHEWSEPFEYTFTINPPWWHTWWARAGYIITAFLLIMGIIRWRTAKLKQRQKELVTEVRNATKEIRAQKNEVEAQRDEIEAQRDEVETQRDEIEAQRNQLEIQRDLEVAQKREITDSISYAQRIQAAMLPPETYFTELLNESFILYKPRDIVSGDFYWIKQVNQYIVLVAADCTGHGVPGALMSMLGISYLNEIVQRREITQANQVLNELRKQIKHSLRQHGRRDESKDGIDMALCVLDLRNNMMQYSGANNPLYLIRDVEGNPELKEIKADHMPVGYYQGKDKTFNNHDMQLEMGDTFYIFSDGFMDQKGGKDNKKFMSKNFKNLLLEIHEQPMYDQKELLDKKLTDWMGSYSQMDDILVIGIRI
jgi:serine phosphatase RsbU (regulator of sigma subunit)